MSKLKKNIFYNVFLQFFNLGFPLITGAYISRVIGATSLGEINFAQSLIAFIYIFTNVGIPTYGIKEIAKFRNEKNKLENIYSELLIIRGILSIIGVIIYYSFLLFVFKNTSILLWIYGLLIIFNIFELDWFFSGIEEYKVITIRNIVVKISIFIFIFIFVKTQKDYAVYAWLLILNQSIVYIISYIYSKKFVKLKIKGLNLLRHYKELKIFFMSSFIISLYTILNNLILAYYTEGNQIAYFNRAKQIQMIGVALTTSITTVLIPRTYYYYENNKEQYRNLLHKSLNYIYIIAIPIIFGLSILSKLINILLGGQEFIPATQGLIILAPLTLLLTFGSWQYYQIILPMKKEILGLKIQIYMACISVICNLLLIPRYGYIGAAYSLLVAEGSGPLLGLYILKYKQKIKIEIVTKSLWKYILASIIMSFTIVVVKNVLFEIKYLIFLIIIGGIVYFTVLFLLKEEIIIEILKQIKLKFLNHEVKNGSNK